MGGSEAPKKKSGSRSKSKSKKDFLTVGIGASAGGVTALKDFFAKMPSDSGMAFVVVLHMSQTHESNLTQILQRDTEMPVIQVAEVTKIEPNHVYVVPPAKALEMTDGIVRLTDSARPRGKRVIIDRFFRTLADAYGESAVAIVLSGTGEDGTLGIKKIKELKGFAIAQKPDDAEFDQMPRSAIQTGMVDWVLPIAEMPEKLLSLSQSTEKLNITDSDDGKFVRELNGADALREILTILRLCTGHDFASYKQATLLRRIARHLQIYELADLPSYVKLLRDNPDEADFLVKNLLINVTNFFRDNEAFEILEADVIPRLFAGKTADDQLRIWSAACSTGEEAYSVAMLLSEYAAKFEDTPKIQIFASDVDDEAIAQAREGLYPEAIRNDVSPERLKRFFVSEGNSFRIKKELREMILFVPHNVLRDPPFSKLDLICCRNLMIYLNRDTQEQLMRLFHFALRPGGFLFLGSSETADSLPHYFSPYNKKQRIYVHRPINSLINTPLGLPLHRGWQTKTILPVARGAKGQGRQIYSFNELHYRLLEKISPPSALINEEYEIVHLSENAGRFLHFGGGEPTNNLLKVVNPDLRGDLRTALFTAKKDRQTVAYHGLPVRIDGKSILVNLKVFSTDSIDAVGNFLLVIFEETKIEKPLSAIESDAITALRPAGATAALDNLTRQLEEELQRTKERLRFTVEEYDSLIEELKAANEELYAINEELHSATEELETSKEELQSVNEELNTVNAELKEKIDEVSQISADWQNLLNSIDIGAIFLDRSLLIKRYTPAALEIFNIIQSDAGRPLEHLTHKLNYKNFSADAEQVLRSLSPVEREVKTENGEFFIARLLPYRTLDDKIDGVVLTFTNITERKRAEETKYFLASIVESSKDSIITLDFNGIITSWNKAAELLYGYPAAEAIGEPLSMLTLPEDIKKVLGNFDKIKQKQAVEVFDSIKLHKNGRRLNLEVVLSPVRNEAREIIGVSTIAREAAQRTPADEVLRLKGLLLDAVEQSIIATDLEGKVIYWNRVAENIFGWNAEEAEGRNILELTTPETEIEQAGEIMSGMQRGETWSGEFTVRNKSGTRFPAHVFNAPIRDDLGNLIGVVGVAIDISVRKRIEAALRHNQEMFSALVANAPFGIYMVDAEFRLRTVNKGARAVFSGIEPLIGRDFEEILRIVWQEPFATEVIERFRHTLRTGESYYSPTVVEQRANLEKIESYDWQLHRIVLPDGSYNVVCYFYDLSEQKRMEAALRKSETHLRLLVESVEDYAILTLSPDNRITSWNTGAENIFGFKEEEVLGEPCAIIFTPEDRENNEPENEIQTAIETGRAADERWHIRKDGSRFYASGVLTVLGENAENGFVKILRDLTERKQFEDTLKEADRRKDEFIATLAHELRNPLAPIRTALEIMRRCDAREKVENAREIIERQTNQLVHLVDDLLDISRITQDKIKLRTERVDIGEPIKAAIETVQPFVESLRHRLDVRLPDKAVFVEADRTRLMQIVFNLLHNSAKYTEPGGHILVIAARENDEAVIRVRDNGIGIQFEMLPAIFDMFAQTATGEKHGQGGLGIGLSLVKKLIEMHGGSVEAHSEGEGRGSEFIIRLPLAAVQKPERQKGKQAAKKAPEKPKSHRILVVDDNADAANMLEIFLSLENHEVNTAFTAREALEKAAELKPDTAILDIGLPDMNGYELAKLLRADFPAICLIALSGWGQDEDRRRSKEAGFNHHLVKPVDVEELKKFLCS